MLSFSGMLAIPVSVNGLSSAISAGTNSVAAPSIICSTSVWIYTSADGFPTSVWDVICMTTGTAPGSIVVDSGRRVSTSVVSVISSSVW